MKILFLDIDGVLNLFPSLSETGKFNKEACINLEFLLNKISDLKIVISSEWRNKGLDVVKEVLKQNGVDPRRVIGATGHEQSLDPNNHRGFQVECWLKSHPEVNNFVIFDDQSDFTVLKDRLIQSNGYVGLTKAGVEKAIEILERND